MSVTKAYLAVHEPAYYRIRVRGAVDAHWTHRLHELQLDVETIAGAPVLTLSGTLRDQAALMGVLNQLYDLGLLIISVELVGMR